MRCFVTSTNGANDSITFRAAFPAIQSAIKVGQDGMRIQFDIPESEMARAINLLTMRNCVLVVAVRRERKEHGL